VLGVVIPTVFVRLEQTRFFSAAACTSPFGIFAVGLGLLACAK